MEEPLLSSVSEQRSETATEKEGGKWSSYQYVGRTGSVIPTASLAGTEVEEIRTAGSFSDHYPPSIHAALVSSPEPDPNVQAIVYQGGYGGEYGGTGTTTDFQR